MLWLITFLHCYYVIVAILLFVSRANNSQCGNVARFIEDVDVWVRKKNNNDNSIEQNMMMIIQVPKVIVQRILHL